MYDTTIYINLMGYSVDCYMEAWADDNRTYTNTTILDNNTGWIYSENDDENSSGFSLDLDSLDGQAVYMLETFTENGDYALIRNMSEEEINELVGELVASVENMAGIDTFTYTGGQLKPEFTMQLQQ